METTDGVNDPKVVDILRTEVENIFGYSMNIEVYDDGDNYSVVTSDGQEVTVPKDYISNFM
jgi:hypothetical protein